MGGRYDRSKSLKANLLISPAIMSRFDLLFVVLDENSLELDAHLARHLVRVHQLKERALSPPFALEQVQRYIRFARLITPQLSPEAQELLVTEYIKVASSSSSPSSSSSLWSDWCAAACG